MHKAIIFDYDDTLVATIATKFAQHQEAARRFYDFELSDQQIKKHWGIPMDQLLLSLYPGRDTIDELYKKYLSLENEFPMQPIDNAIETIKKLIKKDFKLFIITASSHELISKQFEYIGITRNYFVNIQCHEDSEFHKPDPRVFDPTFKLLANFDIEKSDTISVGDSLKDLQASKKAGIKFYAIPTGLTPKDTLIENGAEVLDDISQILEIY